MTNQAWASLADDAVSLILSPLGWSECYQLRNGVWVVRFGQGASPVSIALGWGDTEQEAYRQALWFLVGQDPSLTTAQVARVLRISPTSVRDHARRGRLVCFRKGDSNSPSRFTPSAVWDLLVKLDRVYPFGEGVSDGV